MPLKRTARPRCIWRRTARRLILRWSICWSRIRCERFKAATRYNITPLSLACTNGNATIIESLLKAGADANATSEEGQTALMTASLTGKVDAIKVLLLAHGSEG